MPLDEPRVARLGYNHATKRYEARWYLGISPRAQRVGSRATFKLYLYRTDPLWGLRSSAEKFARLQPDAFAVRGDASAFAGFEQGYFVGINAPRAAQYDAANVYSAQYTTPELVLRLGAASQPAPTHRQALDALAAQPPSPREPMSTYAASVTYTSAGEWALKHIGVYSWAPDRWEASWIASLDPDIPNGYATWLFALIDAAFTDTSKIGAKLDGVQTDSFMTRPTVNLRADHLALTDVTLTYDFNTYRPGVHTMVGHWEYLRALRERLDTRYGKDRGISINFWGMATVNFLTPYIDGFGGEGQTVPPRNQNWNPRILDYRRATAYHKMMLFGNQQPNLTDAQITDFLNTALAYGIVPRAAPHAVGWPAGSAARLDQTMALVLQFAGLGWEPVTHAQSNDAALHIERFGREVFTVHNTSGAARDGTIRVEIARLGYADARALRVENIVTGHAVNASVEGNVLVIRDRLDAGATAVYRLK